MDDQNNNPTTSEQGSGGGTPPTDQSAPTQEGQPTPAASEKCSTCGNQAVGGNCVPCGQNQTSCACPPPTSPQAGSAEGGQGSGTPPV